MWNRQCLGLLCMFTGAQSAVVADEQEGVSGTRLLLVDGEESYEYNFQLLAPNGETWRDVDYISQPERRRLQLKSTKSPSIQFTKAPAIKSTKAPSTKSTEVPSIKSTKAPSIKSTKAPSIKSTKAPSIKSTKAPSAKSTKAPTVASTFDIFKRGKEE